MGDFNYDILKIHSHRPWPMPAAPWVMTQTWNDLLFAHWPTAVDELRQKIPAGFELDLFEGQAYVAVVPFHMTNVSPRGVPALPYVSAFPELNVRTYVRVGGKPGVYFFSLDAGNALVIPAARALFHLPYFHATMTHDTTATGTIDYRSSRAAVTAPAAELRVSYRPTGPETAPVPGTLEYFLTERYCLFTVDRGGHACIVEIHHPPWPLQAAEATFQANTMAEAAGLQLAKTTPILHFARRQDVVAWPIRSLTG